MYRIYVPFSVMMGLSKKERGKMNVDFRSKEFKENLYDQIRRKSCAGSGERVFFRGRR